MFDDDDAILFAIIIAIAMTILLSGCISYGPSEWRPEQHAALMRMCHVACHPGRMATYDSESGECACVRTAK